MKLHLKKIFSFLLGCLLLTSCSFNSEETYICTEDANRVIVLKSDGRFEHLYYSEAAEAISNYKVYDRIWSGNYEVNGEKIIFHTTHVGLSLPNSKEFFNEENVYLPSIEKRKEGNKLISLDPICQYNCIYEYNSNSLSSTIISTVKSIISGLYNYITSFFSSKNNESIIINTLSLSTDSIKQQTFNTDEINEELINKNFTPGYKVIKTDKSFFYQLPNEESKTKTYVIASDIVYCTEQSGNFYKCNFDHQGDDAQGADINSNITGWIKVEDIGIDVLPELVIGKYSDNEGRLIEIKTVEQLDQGTVISGYLKSENAFREFQLVNLITRNNGYEIEIVLPADNDYSELKLNLFYNVLANTLIGKSEANGNVYKLHFNKNN